MAFNVKKRGKLTYYYEGDRPVLSALVTEEQADGVAFADARERDLQERLARVQAILKSTAASTDPDLITARERATRVAGALTWQLAQAQAARVWDAKKNLRELDQQLAQARSRDAGRGDHPTVA